MRMSRVHYIGVVLMTIFVGLPAFVLAGAIAGLPVYVHPPVDVLPAKADVVYVIGPPTRARLALARKLLDEGVSDQMVISVSPHVLQPGYTERKFRACNRPGGDIICISPEPFTTQGEAAALGTMATQYGWHSAIVITRTTHVVRARMYLQRCFAGDLAVIDSGEPSSLTTWGYEYLYQTGAFVKSLTERGC
ncbi:MAG: YdcF family protein [Nakamurella sp.]